MGLLCMKLTIFLKGYDKAAHPAQVLPKKIIEVNQPVIAIALMMGTFILSNRTLIFK